jgi:DNA-binding response OmpR family regulator
MRAATQLQDGEAAHVRIAVTADCTVSHTRLNQSRLRPLTGMKTNLESTSVVLLVEDEGLLRALAAWRLEEAGFEVVQAANAAEALEAMKSRPDVDVLFTDVQMPGTLDGVGLARKIHEQRPNVLLLITSGNARTGKVDIPDHGHFLAKPYRSEDVISEIDALAREAAARSGDGGLRAGV